MFRVLGFSVQGFLGFLFRVFTEIPQKQFLLHQYSVAIYNLIHFFKIEKKRLLMEIRLVLVVKHESEKSDVSVH